MFVHEICTQTLCEYIYNTSCVSDGGTLCVKIDDGRVKLIYLLVLLTIPLLKFKALKIDISVCLFPMIRNPVYCETLFSYHVLRL